MCASATCLTAQGLPWSASCHSNLVWTVAFHLNILIGFYFSRDFIMCPGNSVPVLLPLNLSMAFAILFHVLTCCLGLGTCAVCLREPRECELPVPVWRAVCSATDLVPWSSPGSSAHLCLCRGLGCALSPARWALCPAAQHSRPPHAPCPRPRVSLSPCTRWGHQCCRASVTVSVLLFSPGKRSLSSSFVLFQQEETDLNQMKNKLEHSCFPGNLHSSVSGLPLVLVWELGIQRISGSQIFHNDFTRVFSPTWGKFKRVSAETRDSEEPLYCQLNSVDPK